MNRELNDEGRVQNLNSNGSRGDAGVFNVKKEKTPFPARVLGPTAEEREEVRVRKQHRVIKEPGLKPKLIPTRSYPSRENARN